MKKWMKVVGGLVVALLSGCVSLPPGAEPGPHGTMAYNVLIEASAPGARIEVNGEDVGAAPIHVKIFGDPDGTFHDFGSDYYVIRALAVTTNQFTQSRYFGTGRSFGPESRIPQRVYFDMNQMPPPPPSHPVYGYPGPYFYPPPPFYGPGYWGGGVRIYGPHPYYPRHY